MKVRFIRPWQLYNPGRIIEPPGLLREWLLRYGYVESVCEKGLDVETAVVAPTENAALRISPPRRKRGRPRKMP